MSKIEALVDITIEVDAEDVEKATAMIQEEITSKIRDMIRNDNRFKVWIEITQVSEMEGIN